MRQVAKRVCLFVAGSFLAIGCMGDKGVAGGSVDGKKIFSDACARCHGADGNPTAGVQARTGVKTLTSARVKAMTDEQLFKQIRNGSKNRLMPAFQGAMSDEQMKALVAHIRTLQQPAAPAPAAPAAPETAAPETAAPETAAE